MAEAGRGGGAQFSGEGSRPRVWTSFLRLRLAAGPSEPSPLPPSPLSDSSSLSYSEGSVCRAGVGDVGVTPGGGGGGDR